MNPNDNPQDVQTGKDLVRWLDGELSPREAGAMERRLEADAGLRGEVETLRELEGLLEQRAALGEAPDVRAAVLARVERDLNENVGWRILPRRWRMPVWAASWAACGIVLALGILGAIEMDPTAPRSGSEMDVGIWEIASAEDLSFVDMIDDALETPGTPVDSMTGWLETADAAGETTP